MLKPKETTKRVDCRLTPLSQLMLHLPSRAVHCQKHKVNESYLNASKTWRMLTTSMLLPVCRQSRTSFESIPASFGFPQLHLNSNTHANTFNEDIYWIWYFQCWFRYSLPATIGDFLSSRSWIAVLAKTTLLFSDAVWMIRKTSQFSSSRWRNLAVNP